jgi:DNA-binding response OmpR family regulator
LATIVVVSDDTTNVKLLTSLLVDAGYEVEGVYSSPEALEALRGDAYDLIFLDVVMPEMDGLELCRRIRVTSQTPIIFISARSETEDKVAALKAGGDDYISKPFNPNELLARTRAALLRARYYTTPDLILDSVDNKVTLVRNNSTVHLKRVEARLLRVLIENSGRTLTRDTLVRGTWSYDTDEEPNHPYLEVCIRRLRSKIEEDPNRPKLLLTIRGVGYKYEPSNHGG